ncbi:cobalamin biosynthesis protein [Comamonas aquatilis]|uniref:cobalamin biosynthesis protein n=1 Tax=Comamonas aquatilis TaxID=1778406 RepID=UPI0039EF3623
MMALIAGWGFRAGALQQSFSDCWEQACQALAASELTDSNWTHAVLASRLHTPAWPELKRWAASATPHADFWMCEEASIRQVNTDSVSLRIEQRFGVGSVSEALAICGAEQLAGSAAKHAELLADHSPKRRHMHEAVHLVLPRMVSADRHATLAIAHCMPASYSMKTGVLS